MGGFTLHGMPRSIVVSRWKISGTDGKKSVISGIGLRNGMVWEAFDVGGSNEESQSESFRRRPTTLKNKHSLSQMLAALVPALMTLAAAMVRGWENRRSLH